MSNFKPEKLTTEYVDGVSAIGPLFSRRYTLTHSDFTGDLFLTIGTQFAWEKLNPMGDEVLGEWLTNGEHMVYCVYVQVDKSPYNESESKKRHEVFRRELPLALEAIRYGDQKLFSFYPNLDFVPIFVHFISVFPQFSGQENWGEFQRYRL
jgi:Staygreen protein